MPRLCSLPTTNTSARAVTGTVHLHQNSVISKGKYSSGKGIQNSFQITSNTFAMHLPFVKLLNFSRKWEILNNFNLKPLKWNKWFYQCDFTLKVSRDERRAWMASVTMHEFIPKRIHQGTVLFIEFPTLTEIPDVAGFQTSWILTPMLIPMWMISPLIYSLTHALFHKIQTHITFPLLITEITESRLVLRQISSVNYSTFPHFLRNLKV